MRRSLLSLLAAGVFAASVSADTIYLTDGSSREGTVVRQDEKQVDLEVSVGRLKATVSIPRREIRHIERGLSANERLTQEVERHRSVLKDDDAQGWFQFAEWLGTRPGFGPDRRQAYEKVISIDPDHARAHRALGHAKVNGRWMTEEEVMAEKGLVAYRGRYVTPEERDRLARRDAEIRSQVRNEMAAAERGERGLPQSEQERRARQVAAALARDPNLERHLLDYRYRHRNTLLGRLGFYDAYPYYYGGLPVQSGVWQGGSFYGTVGYARPRSAQPVAPRPVSPGVHIPFGSGAIEFGTNFGGGGGWRLGFRGNLGGATVGASVGGSGTVTTSGSSTTSIAP